jgi:hypothetical protein
VSSSETISAPCSGGAVYKGKVPALVVHPPSQCNWQFAATDGVSYALEVDSGARILGENVGEGQACAITPTSSTDAGGLFTTDQNPIGGGSYIKVQGLSITDTGVGAKFTNVNSVYPANTYGAAAIITQLFDKSEIHLDVTNAETGSNQGTSILAGLTCCDTTLDLHADGFSDANNDVCVFGGVSSSSIAFSDTWIRPNCINPAAGKRAINHLSGGLNLHFVDPYIEQRAASGNLVEFCSTGADTGPIYWDNGLVGAVNTTTTTALQIDSGCHNYHIRGWNTSTMTKAIVDNSLGSGVTCTQTPCVVPDYGYSQYGSYNFNGVTAAPSGSLTIPSTGTATLPDGTTNTSSGYTFAHALTLPNGSVATTQSAGDNSTKVATTAYVRGEQYLTYSCPVATAGTVEQFCTWTLPAGITVTGFDLSAGTAPAGCSTYPTIQVWDGTANAEVGSFSISMTSGNNFYTQATGSTNVASGHALRIKTTTGQLGCSTGAASVVAVVTYQMQN